MSALKTHSLYMKIGANFLNKQKKKEKEKKVANNLGVSIDPTAPS